MYGLECLHYNGVIIAMVTAQIAILVVVQSFIQAQIKENTKALRHWPLCVTGEFPARRASNAEIVSIWWRHHDVVTKMFVLVLSNKC